MEWRVLFWNYMAGWVDDLLDSGRVRVKPWGIPPDEPAATVLRLDQVARADAPFTAPPLAQPAAVWALSTLYCAMQALVYREVDEESVREALSASCPQDSDPAVCYSVDLSFRLLPDLISLARGAGGDDPLLDQLLSLAAAWPLSSVGIRGVGPVDPSSFLADRCLRRIYVDRILDRGDVLRLDHPVVRDAVRAALGSYPELSPAIARALQKESSL